MNRLSDEALAHLRDVTERPELPGDRYEIHNHVACPAAKHLVS